MAVAFVGAGATATGANPTVAVPAGYAAGDTLIIVTAGTVTTTTPSGWTLLSAQGSGQFITIFYKTATASESSVALTNAGTGTAAVMIDYSGVGSFSALPAYATGAAGTATPNTFTTPTNNCYVVDIYACGAGTAITWTANASTAARVNLASQPTLSGFLIADELQATAGVSTARAATMTKGVAWSAVAFALAPPYYLNISGVTISGGIALG